MTLLVRHKAVFTGQIKEIFNLTPDDVVLDCTLGDGNHTQEALEGGCKVISLDIDQDALKRAKIFIPKKIQTNWKPFRENYSQAQILFKKEKLPFPDVIIFDLGTSQHQLANSKRGFSFQKKADLDMRLDNRLQLTAKDLVNALSEKELSMLFYELADETYAKPIARAIITRRKEKPIITTIELADIILQVKKKRSKTHPATKVFQALRMAVNLERENLKLGLSACFKLLRPKGRMGVISFHSGEDRLVKHHFRFLVRQNQAKLLTQKPIKPNKTELLKNQKIRSAKLRLIQKN